MPHSVVQTLRFFLAAVFLTAFILNLLVVVSNNSSMTGEMSYQHHRPKGNWEKYLRNAYNMSLINGTDDFKTLVNLTDFRFLMNNRRCDDTPDQDLLVVVFVHSAPKNFEKRRAIRRTWGNEQNLPYDQIRLVFMLGTVGEEKLQKALEEEDGQHHDLIQGNFEDSYRNLTYKHVMGLKWVTYYCRNAQFVLKTDDDIFVDIFQLASYLKGYRVTPAAPARDLIMCFMINNLYVKRSEESKWRVSFQEYPNKYYPSYCMGWGIVMSPDVVFNLYLQSSKVPYFWVDDVHVSGTLAKKIGVTHIDFTPKLDIKDKDIKYWLESDKLVKPLLFGHPDSDVETIYALWNKTIRFYEWEKSTA